VKVGRIYTGAKKSISPALKINGNEFNDVVYALKMSNLNINLLSTKMILDLNCTDGNNLAKLFLCYIQKSLIGLGCL